MISVRFGLDGNGQRMLPEAAAELDLPVVAIRRIETEAIARLRDSQPVAALAAA